MRKFVASLLIICLLGSLCLVAGADNDTDYRESFTDIKGHWAEDAINRICQLELMTGVKYVEGGEDNRFGVNDAMSRAMLATVLYRVEAKYNRNFEAVTEGAASCFTDVPTGTWYSEAVVWAERTGVISGVSATEFAPTRSITRQEAATMIYRYANVAGAEITTDETLDKYLDKDKIADFATKAMQWVVDKGIVIGTSTTTLSPWANASRAQFAVLILRMLQVFGYEEADEPVVDPNPPEDPESRRAIYEWVKAQWIGKEFVSSVDITEPYAEKWSAYYNIDTAYGTNFIQVSYLDYFEQVLKIELGCGFAHDPSITGFNRTGRSIAETILRRIFPNDSEEVIELMNKVFKLEIGEAGQAIVPSVFDYTCAGVLRYIDNRAVNIAYGCGKYGAYVVIYIGDKYDRAIYDKAYNAATAFGDGYFMGRPPYGWVMERSLRPEFHYAEIKEKALADLFQTP